MNDAITIVGLYFEFRHLEILVDSNKNLKDKILIIDDEFKEIIGYPILTIQNSDNEIRNGYYIVINYQDNYSETNININTKFIKRLEIFKTNMKKLYLYDEDRFGIYTILDVLGIPDNNIETDSGTEIEIIEPKYIRKIVNLNPRL